MAEIYASPPTHSPPSSADDVGPLFHRHHQQTMGSGFAASPPPKLEELSGAASVGIVPQAAWDSFYIRNALPGSSNRREIRQQEGGSVGEGTGVAGDVGLSRTGRRVFAGGAVAEDGGETGFGELVWEEMAMEKRRNESEVDELEFGSEDALEELAKPPPSRTSSKRSRAAEVHNLSEKRRRRRINEKMKALQKLIPNANKTDKASMLDEAIEYLKQLQLQVQMLSMRNGLSIPSMYMPQEVQLMQMPQMTINIGGSTESSLPMNMGIRLPPMNEANVHKSIDISTQCASSIQPTGMPNVPNAVSNSEIAFGLDASQVHIKQYQFPTGTSDEMYRANILPQQLDIIQSTRTAASLPVDGQPMLEGTNSLKACLLDRHESLHPKDAEDKERNSRREKEGNARTLSAEEQISGAFGCRNLPLDG